MSESKEIESNKALSWLKKLGFVGFLFFLIKGLIWLAIFFGLAKYFS